MEVTQLKIFGALESCDHVAATRAAVAAYGPGVLRFLGARLRSDTESDDAFSLWLERLHFGWPRYRGESSPRTFAYGIAKNVASEVSRASRRHAQRNIPLSQAKGLDSFTARPRSSTAPFCRTGPKARFRGLFARLDAEEQAMLALRKDMKWEQVAQLMISAKSGGNIDEQTLKRESARLRKRYQAAKNKLRKWAAE